MLRAIWLGLCLLFVGCGETPSGDRPPPDDSAVQSEEPAIDPNSMQAQQDAQRARELHPGKAHYDRACTSCHGGAVQKAPHREMLGLMTPEAILGTMTSGVMQAEAAALTDEERVAVAEYLAASPLGGEIAEIPACSAQIGFDSSAATLATNWGLANGNGRNIDASSSGLSGADFSSREPKWAISLPGANRARSQPAFAGSLMFVGAHNGKVYALDQDTGCRVWAHQAAAEVRTAIVVGPLDPRTGTTRLFFGDVLGNVYAIDASSGALLWRVRADDHPNATITGSPTLHESTLYVPISALEVSLAIDPAYACCTFRGSVLALDTATGDTRWRTYTIAEAPRVQKQTEAGTDVIGPSGAVIWNSPSIDVKRNQLYVGTGENMSSPATTTSDALYAMDLDTGEVNWVFQATPKDAWNVACGTDTPQNCPDENGPDYDFWPPISSSPASDALASTVAAPKS